MGNTTATSSPAAAFTRSRTRRASVLFPDPGAPAMPTNTRASPSPSPKNAAATTRAASSSRTASWVAPSGAHGNGTPGSARGGDRRDARPSARETEVSETRRRALRSGLRTRRGETAARGNAAVASEDIARGTGMPSRARREE